MTFFSGRRKDEDPSEAIVEPPSVPKRSLPAIQNPIGFETVLGASSMLEGNFTSQGNTRLDGTFSGTLEITGNVLVGETANINADIHAHNISIAGTVRGNVHGKKVQLLRTGRVWGDIHASALTTEEGAFIDGKISMAQIEKPEPEPPATPDPLEELAEIEAIKIDDNETIPSHPEETEDETDDD